MKKLDLNAYGVQEMTQQEMLIVEGGCIICKIVEAIGEAVKDAIDNAVGWVEEQLH